MVRRTVYDESIESSATIKSRILYFIAHRPYRSGYTPVVSRRSVKHTPRCLDVLNAWALFTLQSDIAPSITVSRSLPWFDRNQS
jgi:hypothetical protein